MPFTKENLMMLYSLSQEDVDQSLIAAPKLVEQQLAIALHLLVRGYRGSLGRFC